ncbi:hypothetical protein EYF80_052477 [Liparis tanakae]|uniref:Uncharacterized protein n=1 Tax=Liparis tanakae TaxID=230148 RepID=A0A4Z2FAG4_9TELE|nr:hypothetical protein EYF80_052477 [Liparis tanakae]
MLSRERKGERRGEERGEEGELSILLAPHCRPAAPYPMPMLGSSCRVTVSGDDKEKPFLPTAQVGRVITT